MAILIILFLYVREFSILFSRYANYEALESHAYLFDNLSLHKAVTSVTALGIFRLHRPPHSSPSLPVVMAVPPLPLNTACNSIYAPFFWRA